MTKQMKQLLAGGLAACLLLLVGGYFLLVKPKSADVTKVKDQVSAQNLANTTLRGQIAQLQQQQAGLVAKQVALREVGQRIPSDPQVSGLVRQLSDIQADTGIDIVGITPGTPTSSVVPAAAAIHATTPVTGASPSASATAGTSAASAVGVVHPGVSTAGAAYQTIPVVLTVQGSYTQMVMLLDRLEQLKRLYVVKALSISPLKGAGGANPKTVTYAPDGTAVQAGALQATVTGEVYDTAASTTSIDLPALNTATGAATPAPTSSVTSN